MRQKDVQDAILNDTRRAKLVDIIDIRYWHYKVDGLYAPEGGKNLAPRQHARKMKVGKVTFDEAYRAVSEYRKKFPGKSGYLLCAELSGYGLGCLHGKWLLPGCSGCR